MGKPNSTPTDTASSRSTAVLLNGSADYRCELDLRPAARPQDGYTWTVRTHWAGARDPQAAQVRQQMTVSREALLDLQAHLNRLLEATS